MLVLYIFAKCVFILVLEAIVLLHPLLPVWIQLCSLHLCKSINCFSAAKFYILTVVLPAVSSCFCLLLAAVNSAWPPQPISGFSGNMHILDITAQKSFKSWSLMSRIWQVTTEATYWLQWSHAGTGSKQTLGDTASSVSTGIKMSAGTGKGKYTLKSSSWKICLLFQESWRYPLFQDLPSLG